LADFNSDTLALQIPTCRRWILTLCRVDYKVFHCIRFSFVSRSWCIDCAQQRFGIAHKNSIKKRGCGTTDCGEVVTTGVASTMKTTISGRFLSEIEPPASSGKWVPVEVHRHKIFTSDFSQWLSVYPTRIAGTSIQKRWRNYFS
jgi:hypothetical protein